MLKENTCQHTGICLVKLLWKSDDKIQTFSDYETEHNYHEQIHTKRSFLLLFYYSCPIFPLCPPLHSPLPASTVNPHIIVHVHGSFIHVLCLIPSFHHYPLSPSPLVSLFHISMSLVLFCSLVYVVH